MKGPRESDKSPLQATDFTHLDREGSARMVDVSAKPPIKRSAVARGKIYLRPETLERIRDRLIKKGDVLTIARIAGILGAKRTSDLIPLCHSLNLDHADVECVLETDGVAIVGRAVTTGPTGVEMEALTSVSLAALTIYDMCKAVDKTMSIGEIALVEKRKETLGKEPSGGRRNG